MNAILLVGHGSLKQASGASMIRLAALLRKRGVVPLSTAAFLNFSKPTFQDGLERLLKKGATQICVQPYFLIDGYYVHTALKKLVDEAKARYPDVSITMSQPFGVHPALVEVVIQRIQEALLHPATSSAVVLMAHGTPTPEANQPIYEIAKQIEVSLGAPVKVAFMECNEPGINKAIDDFASQDYETIVAIPYFLHMGSHVQEDLPGIIQEAQARHSNKRILLGQHLGFDERLTLVMETRVKRSISI